MREDLKLLIEWLKNNNKAWLCAQLGYQNTSVIDGWLRSKSIPSYQIDKVRKIVRQTSSGTK